MTFPALHIPVPCSEDWDGMIPTACGRFCNVCQKEVIDLSVMDDATVIQTIAEKGNALCARARKDQLAPPMTAVRSFSLAKLALFALALVSIFSGGLVTASPMINADIIHLQNMNESILTVKVTLDESDIIPNARVDLYLNGECMRSGLTDSSGYCTFFGIPAGSYVVKVFYQDRIEILKVGVGNSLVQEVRINFNEVVILTGVTFIMEIEDGTPPLIHDTNHMRRSDFTLKDLRRIPSR